MQNRIGENLSTFVGQSEYHKKQYTHNINTQVKNYKKEYIVTKKVQH